MLILTEKCKRCGREFVPAPCHVYRIGADLFCGYTCHLHEVSEREEAKRKREEEAIERKRQKDKKRMYEKYVFNKNNMTPYVKKRKKRC